MRNSAVPKVIMPAAVYPRGSPSDTGNGLADPVEARFSGEWTTRERA